MSVTRTFLTVAALSAALLTGALQPVRAEPPHWHGHFHGYDLDYWHRGHWVHGAHHGHLGWWWKVGPAWYFYPAPVYPYPDFYQPPVAVEPAPVPAPAPQVGPPPTQYWYYCEPAKQYYPYVPSCPSGWRAVPANPQ